MVQFPSDLYTSSTTGWDPGAASPDPEPAVKKNRNRNRIRHGFYNRWLLISLCAHMEYIRHFDLLKAFGYIERVIKFDFFRKKVFFTSYVRNMK